MADVINMKAVKTFYGTDGYIVAGQEFFTTSQNLAESYYAEGKAVFMDGSEPQPKEEDLKVQARNRYVEAQEQTEFKTSQLERNVTSLANPVNLKISVSGVDPEDVNVEVVRDEEAKVQDVTIRETQAQNPSQKQQLQPEQTQDFERYEKQIVQPSNQQANINKYAQPPANRQEAASQNEDPGNRDLGEAGSPLQQAVAGYDSEPSQPAPQQQSAANSQGQSQEDLRKREQELIQQLNELREQQSQARTQSPAPAQAQSQEQNGQAESQEQNGSQEFTVRHVGGGWYDLPNGERVQGKENAEARLQEIQNAYEQQQGVQAQGEQESGSRQVGTRQFPNPDRVRQANAQPEDGASLNQAQVETYGNLSGGQETGRLTGSAQNNNVGRALGNGVGVENSTNNIPNNESRAVPGTGTGASGNTVGTTGGNGGNTNGSTGGNTGGSTGGGNTGQ